MLIVINQSIGWHLCKTKQQQKKTKRGARTRSWSAEEKENEKLYTRQTNDKQTLKWNHCLEIFHSMVKSAIAIESQIELYWLISIGCGLQLDLFSLSFRTILGQIFGRLYSRVKFIIGFLLINRF